MGSEILCTITGTDIDGATFSEEVALPRLTPEQEAAALRSDRILRKIWRGAYHTERRQAKAARRYFRAVGSVPAPVTEHRFRSVTEIVFTTPGASGSAPIFFGYGEALGESFAEGLASGIVRA